MSSGDTLTGLYFIFHVCCGLCKDSWPNVHVATSVRVTCFDQPPDRELDQPIRLFHVRLRHILGSLVEKSCGGPLFLLVCFSVRLSASSPCVLQVICVENDHVNYCMFTH